MVIRRYAVLTSTLVLAGILWLLSWDSRVQEYLMSTPDDATLTEYYCPAVVAESRQEYRIWAVATSEAEHSINDSPRPLITYPRYICSDTIDPAYWCYNQPGDLRLLLPRVFIIGFPKCSSTALGWLMSLHPLVELMDEPYYFNTDTSYDQGLSHYCQLAPCAKHRGVVIDKTPEYVMSARTAERIYSYDPTAKVIVLVRDPVERMLSHLAHYHGAGTWEEQAHHVWDELYQRPKQNAPAITQSQYSAFLRPWIEKFPLNKSLLIVDSDDVTKQPYHVVYRVEDFLGIPHDIQKNWIYYDVSKGFFCVYTNYIKNTTQCMGSHKGTQHSRIPRDVRSKFYKHFTLWNNQFFKLAGQTFAWSEN